MAGDASVMSPKLSVISVRIECSRLARYLTEPYSNPPANRVLNVDCTTLYMVD